MYRVDGRILSNLFLLCTLKPALSLLGVPSSLSRNINIVYQSIAMMMVDNDISTEYTKVPINRLVYTQPSKSSYPKRSSNWRNGLYDILDLVEESIQQGEDNPIALFQNEKYVCIYDMYLKAKYHMLLMRRKNVQHIGQMNNIHTLNDLQPSHLHEMKEFHTLARNIATNLESYDQSITMKLGYHAVPSFEPLHLHIISTDLNSKCITKRKHVVSFTSPLFFVDPISVESHLESAFADSCLLSVRKERAASVLNDTPMVCTRCKRQAISVPDWKRHNEVCDVISMERETYQKLNSLLGWKRQPLSEYENRGTKRSLSTTVSSNGVQTKFGKRLRKVEDKETNNARIRNTYLKIDMDESIFDQLHNMVNRVGREWTEENSTRHQQSKSKKQAKKQLTISPRSQHSLHMTYFFVGRVLNDMPSEEVQRWNDLVRSCVSEHNKFSRNYTLSFKSLILFPPNRNYLIVAEFEASSDLVDLYDQFCNLALMQKSGDNTDDEYEFPQLRELTLKQQQYDSKWIPHITLGNVQGGSREDVTRLGEWLGKKTHEDTSSTNVLGLSLGGPVPQVDIDWKFPFLNSK